MSQVTEEHLIREATQSAQPAFLRMQIWFWVEQSLRGLRGVVIKSYDWFESNKMASQVGIWDRLSPGEFKQLQEYTRCE